jgi:predicted kinase
MAAGAEHVIVDNTNTQRWEFQRYIDAAVAAGYEVRISAIEPVAEMLPVWAARGKHNVPLEVLERMMARWES